MSKENVEVVRRLQPNPDTDLVTLFRDEAAFAALTEAVSPFLHADCFAHGLSIALGLDALGTLSPCY